MALSEYELVLLLDPRSADSEREALVSEAKKKLSTDGSLDQEADWGMRKMAYEIDSCSEAEYRYFRFSGDEQLLDQLNHALKIADGILRFRVFEVDPDSPVIVPPDTETIMRRDDDDRGRGRGGGRGDRGGRRSRDDEGGEDSGGEQEQGSRAEPSRDEQGSGETSGAASA